MTLNYRQYSAEKLADNVFLFGVRTLIKLSILSIFFLGLNVSRDHSTLAVSGKVDSGQVGTTTKSTTQRNA